MCLSEGSLGWVWRYMPIIIALRREMQEDHEFEASPGLHSETLSGKHKTK
jgi:hypothetical protein